MKTRLFSLALLMVAAALVGCSTTYKTEAKRDNLIDQSNAIVNKINQEDPSSPGFLHNSAAYAVFPHVGKGALVAGAAYGKGVLYEHGQVVGYCDMKQASVGAQAGGQEFAEVIAFENPAALNKFKQGDMTFTANVSAVAVKSGAAQAAKYRDGVVVFIRPDEGLMAEASVGGQAFSFRTLDQVAADPDMHRDTMTHTETTVKKETTVNPDGSTVRHESNTARTE